ncbi:hypothetical protein PRIPAC_86230 [Pristionchus pacificus]|uniref:Uncharacterized protein n=1 Tax=Pristionchus pacificus TaxID=54126 RepID=A0A2A6CEJ9_PRIPA|nr:hypothetical protein PRIPAC_86230 [Pristionchus pacificus]|eukprot:PDM76549.1 hypothetical protein PRIPAC_42915 [Pristionchus pacificus]
MNRPSYGQGPTTSKGNISEGTMQAIQQLAKSVGLSFTDEQMLAFVRAIEAGADPAKLVNVIVNKRI